MSTNNYISSARRLALLLFGLGLTALLIVWSETERQKRVELFAYIEKIITAQQAIGTGNWDLPRDTTSDWRLIERLNKDTNAAAILQVAKEIPKLEVHFREGPPRTRADPINECPVHILTFPPGGKEAQVGVTLGRKQDAIWTIQLQKIFLIGFDETCTLLGPYIKSAIIMRLPPEREIWVVALETEILKDLRSVASQQKPIRRGIVPGALAVEEGIPRDIKDGIYLDDLKSFVLARAKLDTGRTYESNDLPKALADLLTALDPKPTVLGMPVPSQIAILVLPGFYFGMSMILWHRVRRIAKGRSNVNEPWIMLNPNGRVEICMVWGWSALLLIAGFFIAWAATLLLSIGAVVFAEDVARPAIIVNLALVFFAEVALLVSLGNILRINTGQGWVGWAKRCFRLMRV